MRRRAFLGAILLPPGALRRGMDYLWSRQRPSGAWQSETYGLLRSGHSLTPLIVNALLDAGVSPRDLRIARAVAFLAHAAAPSGALGLSADDYPCYATALALRAFTRTGHPLAPRLVAWLRTQQMSPANGWSPNDLAFGAWGIGGAPRTAPDSGHIDISMTRHVLEAFAEAGVPAADPAMRHALVFVNRCQNPDGGFYFSTVETGANKAGETESGYASYGTTTADGLICQRAAGASTKAASEWLHRHDHPELPAGFESPARRRYAEGLRYYYADAAARAIRRTVPFQATLSKHQKPNGSWQNAEPLVKEDDPLISTAFAVSALAFAQA